MSQFKLIRDLGGLLVTIPGMFRLVVRTFAST